jgi:hypothetical protein
MRPDRFRLAPSGVILGTIGLSLLTAHAIADILPTRTTTSRAPTTTDHPAAAVDSTAGRGAIAALFHRQPTLPLTTFKKHFPATATAAPVSSGGDSSSKLKDCNGVEGHTSSLGDGKCDAGNEIVVDAHLQARGRPTSRDWARRVHRESVSEACTDPQFGLTNVICNLRFAFYRSSWVRCGRGTCCRRARRWSSPGTSTA